MTDSSEVSSAYLCPICREVIKKVTQIKECGHRFCEECLQQTRPSNDGLLFCPICRHPFLMSNACHDVQFELDIRAAQFTCRGCQSRLPLRMYNGHQNTCKKLSKEVHQFRPSVSPQHHTKVAPNRSTFHCPLCEQGNFDCNGLREHVNQFHPQNSKPVVCPVCATMPWGNSEQRSANFVTHLNLRHKFEYETYVDYDQDEDAVLRATIQASLRDT